MHECKSAVSLRKMDGSMPISGFGLGHEAQESIIACLNGVGMIQSSPGYKVSRFSNPPPTRPVPTTVAAWSSDVSAPIYYVYM